MRIDKKDLQNRIATDGWGLRFLSERHPDGHWGDHFYLPKWISTHYTLLDLRNLNLPASSKAVQDTIKLVLRTQKSDDGGIRLGPSTAAHSDVCVNGMFLNYASYFRMPEINLQSIVDSILAEIMPDGDMTFSGRWIIFNMPADPAGGVQHYGYWHAGGVSPRRTQQLQRNLIPQGLRHPHV